MAVVKATVDLGPIVLCAVDIEATGFSPVYHHIVSIGWCLGSPTGKVFDKGRVNVKVPPIPDEWPSDQTQRSEVHGDILNLDLQTGWEKRCYEEFWKPRTRLFHELQKDPQEVVQAVQVFREVVEQWERKGFVVHILTDNPTFDISFLDAKAWPGHLPLKFNYQKKYGRQVIDTNSFHRGVLYCHYDLDNHWVSKRAVLETMEFSLPQGVGATHFPDDDAEYIYQLHVGVTNKLCEWRIACKKKIALHDQEVNIS
jgi:hypothetical protein